MTETVLPKLRVRRAEANQKIQTRIEKGQQLHVRQINSDDELEKARAESKKWSDYNETLLLRLFDNTSIAEYAYTDFNDFPGFIYTDKPMPLSEELGYYQKGMDSSINSLEGIRDRLELYDEPSDVLQRTPDNAGISNTSQSIFGDKVFIVHGHDDEAKETVARFVENFGIEATILHEQANRGQTIPEKFEEHAGEAGFAIILLTPDDVGASQAEANKFKPRARQNVVLGLGYFWGRLGRGRVCVLHKGGVELPSDMQGLLYVPMNSPDEWQLSLAREMKQAGLPINLNKLV